MATVVFIAGPPCSFKSTLTRVIREWADDAGVTYAIKDGEDAFKTASAASADLIILTVQTKE